MRRLWQQDPISCHLNARATEPLAISDRVSRRAFQRLEIFEDVYRPVDTADCFRLYLPAQRESHGSSRSRTASRAYGSRDANCSS